jgi:hypothetical protein
LGGGRFDRDQPNDIGTQGRTSPKSIFPSMMGNQTHCLDSTIVPPTSAAWAPLRTSVPAPLTPTSDNFLTLLCRCEDMMPLQQVQMFSGGLGEPLHTNVELATPSDLQSAMSLARTYEWCHVVATADSEATSSPESNMTTSSAVLTHATLTTPRTRLRRLSPKELAAKRADGDCYHCTEKYVKATSASPRACTCLSWTTAEILGQQPQTWISTSCSRACGQALC